MPTLTAKNLTFPEPCLISKNLIILWLTSSVVYVLCTSSSVKKVEMELCRLASVLRLHYNESSLMLLSTDEIEHEIGPTIIDVVFKLLINYLEFWISLLSHLMSLPWGNFLRLILITSVSDDTHSCRIEKIAILCSCWSSSYRY